MTTSQLKIRAMRLTMATRQIAMNVTRQPGGPVTAATLRATFRVTRNLKSEPNTAEIRVWNLSRESRAALESSKTIPVLLEAGYVESGLSVLYNGQMRAAEHVRDGAAIITSIATGDGETAVSGGRAFAQIPAKMDAATILKTAAKGLLAGGIGKGNLDAAAASATANFGGPARTLHGNAARVFTDICTANGFEWSVQDGSLQVLKIGAMTKSVEAAVRLSAASGMIGSPSVDTKGILKVKALIQPGLMPGLPVVIDGELLKGTYRIEEVEFSGDTWDQEWYADITGRRWV